MLPIYFCHMGNMICQKGNQEKVEYTYYSAKNRTTQAQKYL